jgi:bile acid:Na+ symporter, BASS family
MTGFGPAWLFPVCVASTVFCVMLGIGLGVAPGDLRRAWRAPGPLLRGLFCVLVAVPAMALVIVRSLDLAIAVQAGVLLMAIAPGAPIALRRSVAASGHGAFAPALQMSVALLAVLAIPLWIAGLNEVYGARISVEPLDVMQQVFIAQLVPLGLGIGCRGFAPRFAMRIEAGMTRAGTVLLILTLLLGIASLGEATLRTGGAGLAACAATTIAALAAGHVLGGPQRETRAAVAIVSAARNPGLALLVAALNHAEPRVIATILAYLVVSILLVTAYVAWRRPVIGPRRTS